MSFKKQVRISFDVNCYDKQHFRDFIKSMQSDDRANFKFIIITTSTDTNYTEDVAEVANVETTDIHYVTSSANKVTAMTTYNIDFHFDSDMSNVKDINNENLQLSTDETIAYLVNWLANTYDLSMKYIDQFKLKLNTLLNGDN